MARDLHDTIDALRQSVSTVIDGSALSRVASELDGNRRHGFRVGRTRLLHELTREVELVDMRPAYALPNTAHWCLGLVNLRGRLIPVYDLETLLEGTRSEPERARLLVSGSDDLATGLVIHDTPILMVVTPDCLVAEHGMVPAGLRTATRAVYRIGGESWIDPDYDALFADLAAHAVL